MIKVTENTTSAGIARFAVDFMSVEINRKLTRGRG
jgi:hypothetical protein